ncbi:MAG: hypothetical protein AAFQ12_14355, partial [Pseudomonadota bacterium]
SAYAGLFNQAKNWLAPSEPYPVIAGYFHLNGQDSGSYFLSTVENDLDDISYSNFAYYDVTLNISRASFSTERFVEQCRDLKFSEVRGMYRIETSVFGSVTPEFPQQGEELEISCGGTLLTVDLLNEPSLDTHTLGQEFYSFSGLFEVTTGFSINNLTRLTLREIEIDPQLESELDKIAEDLWEKIGPAV